MFLPMIVSLVVKNFCSLLDNLRHDALDREAGPYQDRSVVGLGGIRLQHPVAWEARQPFHGGLAIHVGYDDRPGIGRGLLADEDEVPVLDQFLSNDSPIHRATVDPEEEELRGLRREVLDGELEPAVVV